MSPPTVLDSSGMVPGSTIRMSKRKRTAGDPDNRALAWEEFVQNPELYRSLVSLVRSKLEKASEGEWRPRKPYIGRAMGDIFGNECAKLRGGCVRGRTGRKTKESHVYRLFMLVSAKNLL